ncbi:hypothetical protein H8B09_19370 [Paenibacillus sp. PR3]|uniref:Uncharacterized protein n=1 Tax=Paenibacillus terricola TaxID=2763503 RepID=A0ABR8MZC4_9BACL|nr:hypothetical protein [Paenibacillus terricola]MBD3920935.1 hypothetical protein [Paenibacillus terricola]
MSQAAASRTAGRLVRACLPGEHEKPTIADGRFFEMTAYKDQSSSS